MMVNNEGMQSWMTTRDGSEILPGVGLAAERGRDSLRAVIESRELPALAKTLDVVITDEIKPYLPPGFVDGLPKYERQLNWVERGVIDNARAAAKRDGMTDMEREAEERRVLEARADWAIRSAGVPAKFQEADISQCVAPLADYVEGFERGRGKNLVLRGDVGSGKTYGACAALRRLAQRHDVRFATMGGILREIRETYGNEASEAEVIEKYARAGVLVIDDFGKEKPTEFALQVMFEIIDGRYREGLPTIFTTQYSSRELVERLSEAGNMATAKAIVSRMSCCVGIVLDGPDRRISE